jgi:ribosomal-protein-alanine N-acetyltransferase
MPGMPVRLQLLDATTLQALIDQDLDGARRAAGVPLPQEFLLDTWLWTLRLGQLIGEPECAPWLVRAVVAPDGSVVGHAGFHGPPDERSMVEVGYRIVPEYRRQGHARAALTELLAFAQAHGARVARASISPANAASLALAASFGFEHIGEQMDEIDGLELLFERPV